MKRDDGGVVNNPLRANIALTLERERARRGLSHMHMAELFRTAEGEKLAYRTYIQTVRQKNNVTLTTLQIMANGLQVSVAGLLAGGKKVPEWAHQLDDNAIRKRLAHIIDMERQRRNLHRYEMAEAHRRGGGDIHETGTRERQHQRGHDCRDRQGVET